MTGAPLETLSVFMENERIGELRRTEPLSLVYDPAWLAKPDARPLHKTMPLGAEPIATPSVHAFFENLLPEGDQRRLLSLRHHVSSVFGLLATVGGDTAGSILLLPPGQAPQPPVYQALSWEQVGALVHAGGIMGEERAAIDHAAEAAGLPDPRLSISGAQFKLLLSLDENGMPLRPMGASPSTHILKPDMLRRDISVFASAVNETLVMRTAALCGLPVARVSYRPEVKACLVERYDRVMRGGRLTRIWQADFCQLSGTPSEVKYETDGGPSFRACYELLARESVRPGLDQRDLLRWLFFNLHVGNNDSHAKNLSLLAMPEGLRLAPFYDLMSTRVYTGLGSHFAFRLAGENEPGKLGADHMRSLATELKVAHRYTMKLAGDVADSVIEAVPAAARELEPLLTSSEQVMVERLQNRIRGIAGRMRARLAGKHAEVDDLDA